MRIKLKEGKQEELIKKAKKEISWEELAKKLNLSPNYIRIDLLKEKVLLSEKNYEELCKIIGENFDKYVTQKLEDNWGRSKGGINSTGSTIQIIEPKKDEILAEIIGAILGDGNINSYKKGKKIGVYQVKIAGDLEKDKDYHQNYLKKIVEESFNLRAKEIICKNKNERFLVVYSKQIVEFLDKMKMPPGDKIKNQVTIPDWIYENESFLKACIRGLIDTDGSIFRMSRKSNLLRINFTNYNLRLLKDVKAGLESLGFFVSKIISDKQIFISRQKDVERYLNEIGFSNQKHLDRLQKFRDSPLV